MFCFVFCFVLSMCHWRQWHLKCVINVFCSDFLWDPLLESKGLWRQEKVIAKVFLDQFSLVDWWSCIGREITFHSLKKCALKVIFESHWINHLKEDCKSHCHLLEASDAVTKNQSTFKLHCQLETIFGRSFDAVTMAVKNQSKPQTQLTTIVAEKLHFHACPGESFVDFVSQLG